MKDAMENLTMTTALNLDIYAHLLTFISSPADLLAVALTSCDLFRLGMPELRYRSIRAHLGNNALWRYLAENPTLASRVRELVILRENAHGLLDKKEMERVLIPDLRSAVPSGRATEADVEESERLLIQALRVLINLESFTWDRNVPLINEGQEVLPLFGLGSSGDARPEVYSEDIWTTLRDHTQVKKLIVMDLGRNQAISGNALSIFDSSVRVPIFSFWVYAKTISVDVYPSKPHTCGVEDTLYTIRRGGRRHRRR